ncbi:hypothetical protein DCAR_0624925 [Daucus carota subsp. sativus]|uniref:PTM/DIR17-like Tudor domain-containing protein n=1 Tax=Daucus carota subsp. sativus TaxID=79200 RepID=A0AAF0XCH1_DAUCS|nr:hypothetical protein DCAR_0624925 [Daucus carota subsp. sativus]
MSSCSGLELERELKEAGIRLLGLESLDVATVQDLLNSLDQVDGLLSKVEQAPSRSMQDALYPSMKALISDQLLKHSDIDVKVSVASCMSELTRITAPDAPYDDVQMKEIFRLTVTALGMLSSEASRGYNKALHILETLSKVRACLLMLDLECDQLIADMFNLFLRIIRYIPLPVVFRQMEYIMTLTIEESEEIPEELLSILLTSVTKKKADQSVFSRSWKLGEKVLRNCAVELQHCLPKVIRSRNLNINDFSDVVASICENSPGDELEKLEGICSLKIQMQQEHCKQKQIPHGINEKLVGRRVKVWWPLDQMFYEGAVASFDSLTQMHKVLYADGDEETLNLSNERWELLEKKAKTKSASLGKPGIISSAKGEEMVMGILPDTGNAEGSDSGVVKKRRRLVSGEGLTP